MRFVFVLILLLLATRAQCQWDICRYLPSFCNWNSNLNPIATGPFGYVNEDSLQQKTQVWQSRQSDIEEWKNISKTEQAYNGQGLLIRQNGYRANEYGVFGLEDETVITYDPAGRLLERRYTETGSNGRSTVRNYVYDQQGRRIEEKYVFTDEEGISDGYWYKSYWNDDGCQGSTTRYDMIDSAWILRDSTILDSDVNCNILYSKYYRRSGEAWLYEQEYKNEYEYNQNGDILEERQYYKAPIEQDWTLSIVFQYEYDSSGDHLLASIILLPQSQFEHSSRRTFDPEGRPLEILIIQKINGEVTEQNQWIYEYDSNGFLLSLESSYLRDTITYSESRTTYDGDPNGMLIKSIRSSIVLNYTEPMDYYQETSETLYEYFCDGLPKSTTSQVISSNNPYSQVGYQTRLLKDYYLRPYCYEEESTEDDLVIFPNPAMDYLNVYYPEYLGNTRIRITDSTGRITYEEERELSNYFSVDLSVQDPGVYILSIENGELLVSRSVLVVK